MLVCNLAPIQTTKAPTISEGVLTCARGIPDYSSCSCVESHSNGGIYWEDHNGEHLGDSIRDKLVVYVKANHWLESL